MRNEPHIPTQPRAAFASTGVSNRLARPTADDQNRENSGEALMKRLNDFASVAPSQHDQELFASLNPRVWSPFWSGWIPSNHAIAKFLRRLPMSRRRETALVYHAHDRKVLRQHILPELASLKGDVLFVGVREYTFDCPELIERSGGRCWTIDIDPTVAAHGVEGRHFTGDIINLPEIVKDRRFSAIILTGLFGFGVYGYHRQMAAIKACVECLTPTGMLVLGWNDRRKHADVLIDAVAYWLDFVPCGQLPPRLWVTNGDYNFACLRKREHAPVAPQPTLPSNRQKSP